MIILEKKNLINTGTNRACYIHPFDMKLCIKINIKDTTETNREVVYYNLLKKKKVSFKMISKYYGFEETNQGIGYKFELIRDYDNSISREVDKYLDNPYENKEDIQAILELLPELKKYLFLEKIYVKDLHPVNVIFQKESKDSGRLVIIDGLAHNNLNLLFKIDTYLLYKLEKKWNSFISTIESKIH